MNVVQNEQNVYEVQNPVSESNEVQSGGAGGEEELFEFVMQGSQNVVQT